MKKNEIEKLIEALGDFEKAYLNLVTAWYRAESGKVTDVFTNIDVNPFEKSFDELNIDEWCFKAIEGLKKIKD